MISIYEETFSHFHSVGCVEDKDWNSSGKVNSCELYVQCFNPFWIFSYFLGVQYLGKTIKKDLD